MPKYNIVPTRNSLRKYIPNDNRYGRIILSQIKFACHACELEYGNFDCRIHVAHAACCSDEFSVNRLKIDKDGK